MRPSTAWVDEKYWPIRSLVKIVFLNFCFHFCQNVTFQQDNVWGGWKWKWRLKVWSKLGFSLLRFPAKTFQPVYTDITHPPDNQNLNLFLIICILNGKKEQEIWLLGISMPYKQHQLMKCCPFTFQDFVTLNLKVRDENEIFFLSISQGSRRERDFFFQVSCFEMGLRDEINLIRDREISSCSDRA